MAKMMKKMDLGDGKKRRMADSSDDDVDSDEDSKQDKMEVEVNTCLSKSIGKKKKVWSRA